MSDLGDRIRITFDVLVIIGGVARFVLVCAFVVVVSVGVFAWVVW